MDVDDVDLDWEGLGMAIEVRPAIEFDDVAAVLGPKRPDASVCWCLIYRLNSAITRRLHPPPHVVIATRGNLIRGIAAFIGR